MRTRYRGNRLGRDRSRKACWLLAFAALLSSCAEPTHVVRQGSAMGQPLQIELHLGRATDAELVVADIEEHIRWVDGLMGWGMADSELARLNREAGDSYYQVQDRDLYRVLRLALDYAQFTHGAYDPTLAPVRRLYERASGRPPTAGELELVLTHVGWDRVVVAPEARSLRFRGTGMELDLGPVGHGFALDRAARAFARPGSRGAVLRLGGHALAWGRPPEGTLWSVEIPDPRTPGRSFARLELDNRACAVYGHPERGAAAVLDAATGRPAQSDLRLALAIADSAADAAALGSALFVAGSARGAGLLQRMHRAEAVLLVEGSEGTSVLASATLRDRLWLSPEVEAEIGGRVRYLLPPQTLELQGPLLDWGRQDP